MFSQLVLTALLVTAIVAVLLLFEIRWALLASLKQLQAVNFKLEAKLEALWPCKISLDSIKDDVGEIAFGDWKKEMMTLLRTGREHGQH